MKPFLFKWLTAVFAGALLSSIVSMMAVFVGSQGVDLRDLLELQVILAPIAAAAATQPWLCATPPSAWPKLN
jgi:hypothetical protein